MRICLLQSNVVLHVRGRACVCLMCVCMYESMGRFILCEYARMRVVRVCVYACFVRVCMFCVCAFA